MGDGKKLTYKDTGVDYGAMDPFKLKCQLAAAGTRTNIERLGIRELSWSRGESAYLLVFPAGIVAHVEEGLGTKNLIAEKIFILSEGKLPLYGAIAQDAVAMIVNDMITLQVLPVSLAMHLAVGSSDWFKNEAQVDSLIEGWKNACNLSRCTWGGGETPTLKDVVIADTAVLSGSGIGFAKEMRQPHVEIGDAIIMFTSSGIHANGLSLARKIADSLQQGYYTDIGNGHSYGTQLLKPTHIYAGAIEDLVNNGIDIHYAVNITGHGWRKLMRLPVDCTYRITHLMPDQQLFSFMQTAGNIDDQEAYGTFNMGAGFAIYVDKYDVPKVTDLINKGDYGFTAWHAGYVEEGEKQVIIEPKGITFGSKSLEVR